MDLLSILRIFIIAYGSVYVNYPPSDLFPRIIQPENALKGGVAGFRDSG